jgi:hypothetical protein
LRSTISDSRASIAAFIFLTCSASYTPRTTTNPRKSNANFSSVVIRGVVVVDASSLAFAMARATRCALARCERIDEDRSFDVWRRRAQCVSKGAGAERGIEWRVTSLFRCYKGVC